jgi:Fe-S-cluster-containing dehydrogenase component
MAKYGMAIDLKRCVGCGACAFACKTENNTDIEHNGKRYNWADFYVMTGGKFNHGNLRFWVFPTLCNHCTNAPCIDVCPAEPKALYKTETGITMLNHDRCIGCGYCINRCPYSDHNVDTAGVQYSVITRNPAEYETHPFYDDTTAIVPGCTMSPSELAEVVGERPPTVNLYQHTDSRYVRPKNSSEKCTFCEHRVLAGLEPYCVVSCPAHARMFGNIDDSQSEISQWMAKGYVRLGDNKGEIVPQGSSIAHDPNVFYVGYDNQVGTPEPQPALTKATMAVYPNPARDHVTLRVEVSADSQATASLFDISGREVLQIPEKFDLTNGSNSITLTVASLKAGTYIVRVIAGQKIFTANLVIVR